MTHNLHAALAQSHAAELRLAASGTRGRHLTPTVTERPRVLEPTVRDPFLDGLTGPHADRTLDPPRA